MTVLAVMVGGAVGAVLRHLVRERAAVHGHLERGTLVVNVAGAGLLGLVAGAGWAPWLLAGITTGVLGSLTTVSTFALDVVNQVERADRPGPGSVIRYVTLTIALGVGAACSALL